MDHTKKQRDPICGMMVDSEAAPTATRDGETFLFSSEFCRNSFLALPEGAHATMDVIPASRLIAYLSMEIALDEWLPTYAGGLGVLAGDITLRRRPRH